VSAAVLPFFRPLHRPRDWSTQDLAEFYRVEAALVQAGIQVETDRGLSDEGDPWFAFCRAADGEVVIHIARVDGVYILAGAAYYGIARGDDIRSLIQDLVSRHPLIRPVGERQGGSNVFLHPAALLVAVVATAFFKISEAQALAETAPESRIASTTPPVAGGIRLAGTSDGMTITLDAFHSAIIVAAIVSVLDPVLRFGAEGSGDLFNSAEPQLAQFEGGHLQYHLAPADGPSSFASAISDETGLSADDHPQVVHVEATEPVDGASALSLLAILWDLPKGPAHVTAAADSKAIEIDETSIQIGDTSQAHAAPHIAVTGQDASRPLLTLSLQAAENWPNLEAAKVILAGGSGVPLELHGIRHVSELPASIMNAVEKGNHITVDQAAPAALSMSAGSHEAAHGEVIQQANQVASAADGDDVPWNVFGDLQAALQHFLATAPNYSVVTANEMIVIYDVQAITDHATEVDSYSWDFPDGSTLSLVGLPSSLPHHVA
jgi:hypothetical protein